MEVFERTWKKLHDHPSIAITCGVATMYAVYYLSYVVKKPRIVSGGSRFKKFLYSHCPIAGESFWPTWWCLEGRMQTVFRFLLQGSPSANYKSEFLKLPDGGIVHLDWECNDSKSSYSSDLRPTVLLMPGLTGTSKESYMLNMVHDATALGYRCVVFMNRGVGEAELKTPRTYCAVSTEDLDFVVSHIKKRYPSAPLMAVGISLGGMLLFNYMAKKGAQVQLEAAMVISVGWNCFAATISLEGVLNYYLFNRTLARGLCRILKRHLAMFESHVDTGHVLKSKTIKEFDERFTAKIFGYKSVEDYYSDASPDYKISQVAKPTLCLSAADDPFCPEHSIPFKNAEESENVAIVIPSRGGHIGFLEGTLPRRHNYMNRWFVQYVDAVFQHAKKDL